MSDLQRIQKLLLEASEYLKSGKKSDKKKAINCIHQIRNIAETIELVIKTEISK